MIWVLVVWNVLLTAGLAYVIGGYLWHINKTHRLKTPQVFTVAPLSDKEWAAMKHRQAHERGSTGNPRSVEFEDHQELD